MIRWTNKYHAQQHGLAKERAPGQVPPLLVLPPRPVCWMIITQHENLRSLNMTPRKLMKWKKMQMKMNKTMKRTLQSALI